MQLIREMAMSAARYVGENFHLLVTKPGACPHCGAQRALEALGYYSRNITSSQATVVRICIRRFRCRGCAKTVSILPSFAQPYRLIQNSTIDRYFSGDSPVDALWWQPLLKQYWKRFTKRLPELAHLIGSEVSRAPPYFNGVEWWKAIVAAFGDLESITTKIVGRYHVTLFGYYRCHSPISPKSRPD